MKPIILTSLICLATTHVAAATLDSRSTKRAASTRIAIATMLSPNDQDPCIHGMGCALLPWCASAQRLRDAITRSPTLAAVSVDFLLVLGGEGASHAQRPRHRTARGTICLMSNSTEELDMRDCPGARRIHAGVQLRRAAALHEERVIRSGVMSYNPEYMRRMSKVLFKWELMRQNDYAAILFSDLDVDLLPAFERGREAAEAEEVSREWEVRLPELLTAARHPDTPFNLMGYGDLTSPWVAGLFWVFPPPKATLYWEGVRMLSAPWNATHGFNRSGTPHELWGGTPTVPKTLRRHADGTTAGSLLDRAIFGRGWQNIDGGDLEQGFILNMLWNRSPQLGVFVDRRKRSIHKVAHYVRGPQKPWRRSLTYEAVREDSCPDSQAYSDWMRHFYLASLAELPLVQRPATACARAFKQAYSEIRTRLNTTSCQSTSIKLCEAKKLGYQARRPAMKGSRDNPSELSCHPPFGKPGGHDRLSVF